MLFNYKAIDKEGNATEGSIDAVTIDVAIASLQRRGLVISTIDPADKKSILDITLFERVSNRDVVILSRQIATLFEAQVSALRVFRLLATEAVNPVLQRKLTQVADDLQGGSTISNALSKHEGVFSSFYVNMVRAGEESGKLDETFLYLADYLDRTYEVTSKARNALIYPAFVVFVFVVVMALMLTLVIPRISEILLEVGSDLPIFTRIIIGISDFVVRYGVLLLILLVVLAFILWRFGRTEQGALTLSQWKLEVPYLGDLFTKLYLSRVADNMSTMLSSGIPMVRALEITSSVVGNEVYQDRLLTAVTAVRGGQSVSDALGEHSEFPSIMIQMIKVGEETGELGNILKTLARFYRREVTNAVDTLVNLIEPILIVLLALMVGILLSAVLLPIYNISSAI